MDERERADIATLRNLGPKSAWALRRAGILTIGDLERVGCVEAFVRVQHVWEGASLNLLWGLAAGLRDIPWQRLGPAEKAALRAEVEALRGAGPGDGASAAGETP